MSQTKYWLHIDKREMRCTLHIDGCKFTDAARHGSKWKEFGSVGQWGGWISFDSQEEAKQAYNKKYSYYGELYTGCSCLMRNKS